MDQEQSEFLALSAELGADSRQVQGTGGSTSLKQSSGIMVVKAAGLELARATTENVFTRVSLPLIRTALAANVSNPLEGVTAPGSPLPSTATALHAVMPHRVVIHTHGVPIVAAGCRVAAGDFLKERLGLLNWVLLEYARPGTPAARLLVQAVERHPRTSVAILANHGVVVGAETVAEARTLLKDVSARLEGPPRLPQSGGDPAALARLSAVHGMTRPASAAVHELALNPVSMAVAVRASLHPGQVPLLGSAVGFWSGRDKARTDPLRPRLWLVPGVGALLDPGLSRAAHAMAKFLGEVVALLPEADACRYLSAADEAELLGP